jgi:hypothetical protein
MNTGIPARPRPSLGLAPLLLALLATPLLAKPPSGTDLNSPEHAWWECHVQPARGLLCCREADGHVLADRDWHVQPKADGTEAYQIRVQGRWFDVPPRAVINESRRCGPEPDVAKRAMAKAWYAPTWDGDQIVSIDVYCFEAGTMY